MTDGATGGGVRVGVDIGGTFTDFVVVRLARESDGGKGSDGSPGAGEYSADRRPRVATLKVPSTPDEPAAAVLEGLERLLGVGPGETDRELTVVHGSTVATNTVLERTGGPSAFVTTRGFEDLLAIGRQVRPELYDLFSDPPEPLIPAERCHGLTERVDDRGEVVTPLAEGELERLADELSGAGVESVAVCFLFSFLRPEHERRVAEALRARGLRVSCSHEVLPEFREYERASTTAMNAYVAPVLERYLDRLAGQLRDARLRLMRSHGGTAGLDATRRKAVSSVVSGPAAGVIGALRVAAATGYDRVLSFDMGGTSTDVSLADGEPRITREASLAGLPVAVPVVDLHTVGSGGGSVARVDAGGALRVGPESAGADPGPACYGQGGSRPTVTDAHLVLGRLAPERFLGGEMELDREAAVRALAALARDAGLGGADEMDAAREAALGVVRVASAHMERALRVISVERGHDPADFVLVSFGGAGGLHACQMARSLGVRRVLVPPDASVLSAYGMLTADVVRVFSRTVMFPGDVETERLEERFGALEEEARSALREEEVPPRRAVLHREADLRYRGQSYELGVPFGPDVVPRFHEEHRRSYGHADPGASVEIVNLRVRAVGHVDAPELPAAEPGPEDPSSARIERRTVVLGADEPSMERVPFYRAEDLRPGHRVPGPAVVTRRDTTLFLTAADLARVDRRFNLVVEVTR